MFLVVVVIFAVTYAFFQLRSGFAVLITPPLGIDGPYYVTAEAKIGGPIVDLATVKAVMNGTYASDHTYVQWGTNPFHRVYADNTLQAVYYGRMVDVMDRLSWGFSVEESLSSAFENLNSTGVTGPSSLMGQVQYFGNMPGVYITYYVDWEEPLTSTEDVRFNIETSSWLGTEARLSNSGSTPYIYYDTGDIWGDLGVYANDSSCIYLVSKDGGNYHYDYDTKTFNSTSIGGTTTLRWLISTGARSTFSMHYLREFGLLYQRAGVTVWVKDLLSFSTSSSRLRTYVVADSPGTGFVSKGISPSSPAAGSTINVVVRFDPPTSARVNVTDLYPGAFTWAGVDVLLEKFRVGTGLVASVRVNVVPTPDKSNMKFTVYHNQAPSVLQSLLGDEYVYLTYSLRVPDAAGEYILPSAAMSYLIPAP